MEDHPGIHFRSGPAGRRPALVDGPDVWEVVRVLHNVEATGERAVEEAAQWLGLGWISSRKSQPRPAGKISERQVS